MRETEREIANAFCVVYERAMSLNDEVLSKQRMRTMGVIALKLLPCYVSRTSHYVTSRVTSRVTVLRSQIRTREVVRSKRDSLCTL